MFKKIFLFVLLGGLSLMGASLLNEGFNSSDSLKGWDQWICVPDAGHHEFSKEVGCQTPGSVRFVHPGRFSFRKCFPTASPKGSLLRASFMLKNEGENAGAGKVNILLYPILQGAGLGEAYGVQSVLVTPTSKWEQVYVDFLAPADGKIAGHPITGFKVCVMLQNILTNIYMDDLKIEPVASCPALWHEGFQTNEAVNQWTIYNDVMVEGVYELHPAVQGYADAGSALLTYKSGQTSYSIAPKNPLPISLFKGEKQLAFECYANISKEAKVMLVMEQLDATGKRIATTATSSPVGTAPGFRHISLPFQLVTGATAVRPTIFNKVKGDVYVDNCSIRPATIGERGILASQVKPPIFSVLYPADAFAYIDNRPVDLSLQAGRSAAFLLMLAGDKKLLPADTIVDIELPEGINFLGAQLSTYGKKMLPINRSMPAKHAGYRHYRLVNPYDWARRMMNGFPNHYCGLVCFIEVPKNLPANSYLYYDLAIGKTAGESRDVPIKLLTPPAPVPAIPIEDFSCGGESLLAINAQDPVVFEKVVGSYMASGITVGSSHDNQIETIPYAEKLGYALVPTIQALYVPGVYYGLYSKPLPQGVLADGRPWAGHLPLVWALEDPELNAAYKKYLAGKIKLIPKGKQRLLNIDIEFWSNGVSTKSDFHPSTIESFRKFAQLPVNVKLDAKTILANYKEKWFEFRGDLTVRIHKKILKLIHEIDPTVGLQAYDYSLQTDGKPKPVYKTLVPTDCLAYDRADAVTAHSVSYYNIEGVNFLDHVDVDAHTLHKLHFCTPYLAEAYPAIIKPSWSYHHISVPELKMEIVGAAASGSNGMKFFSGIAYDGERLNAIAEAMHDVAKYQKFYFHGTRCDKEIKVAGLTAEMRYRAHKYKGKTLVTLFNCGSKEQAVTVQGKTVKVPGESYLMLTL